MDMLRWRTPGNPVLTAAVILCLVIWVIVLYQRRRKSDSLWRTVLLLAPKVLVAILLIFSFFDPVWTVVQHGGKNRKILVLTDVSSSMTVADSDGGTRARRAEKLQNELKSELKSLVDVEVLAFDEDIGSPTAVMKSWKTCVCRRFRAISRASGRTLTSGTTLPLQTSRRRTSSS